MKEIALNVLACIWFCLLYYYIYKIGFLYFQAIAIDQKRKYKGYYKEYQIGGFNILLGILPIPYIGEEFKNSKSKSFMKKRKYYVFRFYLVFFGFMFFLQVIKWGFEVSL